MAAKDQTAEAMRARVFEVRRARLRLLLDQYESMTDFAAAIGESLNYTSRLVKLQKSGRKNLGEGKARKIEAQLGLARGWLDQEINKPEAPPPRRLPLQANRAIWDALSPAEQREAEAALLLIIGGIEAKRAGQKDTG